MEKISIEIVKHYKNNGSGDIHIFSIITMKPQLHIVAFLMGSDINAQQITLPVPKLQNRSNSQKKS